MNRKIEKEIIRLVDDDEDQRRALRFLQKPPATKFETIRAEETFGER